MRLGCIKITSAITWISAVSRDFKVASRLPTSRIEHLTSVKTTPCCSQADTASSGACEQCDSPDTSPKEQIHRYQHGSPASGWTSLALSCPAFRLAQLFQGKRMRESLNGGAKSGEAGDRRFATHTYTRTMQTAVSRFRGKISDRYGPRSEEKHLSCLGFTCGGSTTLHGITWEPVITQRVLRDIPYGYMLRKMHKNTSLPRHLLMLEDRFHVACPTR